MASSKHWIMAMLVAVATLIGAANALGPRVVCVGSDKAKAFANPWGPGVKDWKQGDLNPGDIIMFRWNGAKRHSLFRFPNAIAYLACDFSDAKRMFPALPVGHRTWRPAKSDVGKTFYFGSNYGSDCADGAKVALSVTEKS